MDISTYETYARKTAIYPRQGSNIVYPVLGLTGEAGEIANKVKKIQRDDAGCLTQERRDELASELGDVLWYCAAVAHELGIPLDDIAKANLKKLEARQQKGQLGGQGDQR